MKRSIVIAGVVFVGLVVFLAWRFVRPMNIFVVSAAFERPVATQVIPAPLRTLRATECASCHAEFYQEWSTTLHSRAWTDPYFQADWKFDGAQQICKNCHIPLDRQQEHRVLGFRDREKWQPVLAPNPDFDPALQHEGVTCAACHLRDGEILGPYGTSAPHAVRKLADTNEICLRCHVVDGTTWDSFLKFSPCGTVAEIQSTPDAQREPGDAGGAGAQSVAGGAYSARGPGGEMAVPGVGALDCVECHMPAIERPLVVGGKTRLTRRHTWRGGHDPETVKNALDVQLESTPSGSPAPRRLLLTLTNTGAAHYLPTGIPDRHLSVQFQAWSADGKLIDEATHLLKRTILWRPFLIDLNDTRLQRWQPRQYRFDLPARPAPASVDVVLRYHLLAEARRVRIDYQADEPISYEVFRRRVVVGGPASPSSSVGSDLLSGQAQTNRSP